MIIETLTSEHEASLLKLWQEAFGDDDAFLEAFFSTAYSADRCRCIMLDGEIAAALYWMPCEHLGKKIAYIYGVATHPDYRGQGLCRKLMDMTHAHLAELAAYARQLAGKDTKIAFNMAWAGEPDLAMPEMINFGGDQLAMYHAMTRVTREVVQPTPGIDRVSPVGTAVQNARTAGIGLLTRDKFHLSYDAGRYIAGITFLKALTGMSIDSLNWAPEGIGDRVQQVAIESANNAVRCPYEVTPSEVPL